MRPGRLLLAGLALAIVVTGCSDPDVVADPPPLATPTAGSASPTPPSLPTTAPASATTTAPPVSTIPAAAQAHTTAGAEAFARYYFERVNQAFQGSGSKFLVGLYDPLCISCHNFVKNVDRLHEAGQSVTPAPYDVTAFTELPESVSDLRTFSAALVHRKSNVVAADGTVVRREQEERTLIELALSWTKSGWTMRDLAQAKIINP